MLETALLLFFPFMMLYAAFSDLVSMTISNKVSLLLIAAFFLFAWLTGMSLQAIGWNIALFALVLTIGIVLFVMGQAGGGDVKLAASTALWLGWEHTFSYFVMASIAGLVLTLILIKARGLLMPERLARVEWIARLHRGDVGIPYGIALGIAAVIVYPDTRWMDHAMQLAVLHP